MLTPAATLFTGDAAALAEAQAANGLRFHPGRSGRSVAAGQGVGRSVAAPSPRLLKLLDGVLRRPDAVWRGVQSVGGGSPGEPLAAPPGGAAAQLAARRRPKGRWPRARCITSYCTDMMWPIASIQYDALWAPGICM